MTLTLPPSSIRVAEGRQRQDFDLASLKASIDLRGVITPIIVTKDEPPVLVAGERRLRASLELGLASIPVRFIDELDPIELKIIELEENVKRKDLSWQEIVVGVEEIHLLYCSKSEGWTQERTAQSIGLSPPTISVALRVAKDIDDEHVRKCGTYREAYNLLQRRDARAAAAKMDELLAKGEPGPKAPEAGATPLEQYIDGLEEVEKKSSGSLVEPPKPTLRLSSPNKILNEDFSKWWPTYSGPKFNLIHCDFPYGIGLFESNGVRTGPQRSQMGRDEGESYGDSYETYMGLVLELCAALPSIASSSCHLMFWFSNKWEIEQWTRATFAERLPALKFAHYPLIWLKSDNAGVASIPDKQPRHIYEAALFGSLGERPLVRLKSDAYAAQTDKSMHTSCKPEPMLRHFMEMLVDEHTVMLDPTCGSGTSVRAAQSLGAKQALGLEIDPKMAEMAEKRRAADAAKRELSQLI